MKTGFRNTVAAALLLVAPVAGSGADVSFAYQGLLLDELGNPTATNRYSIVFRIYDQAAGGSPLWSCTKDVLLDEKGQFSVELSGNGPFGNSLGELFAANAQKTLFIGLTVDNDAGEISPRQKLLSVPRALWATDSLAAQKGMTVAGALHGGAASLQDTGARSLAVSDKLTCGSLQVTPMTCSNLSVSGPITGKSVIPVRGIVVWSGSQESIPLGWALCDGKTHNGITTPDLRNRFIVGAGTGSEYTIGKPGGEKYVTLTEKQLPVHSHTYKFKAAAPALALNSSTDLYYVPGGSSYKQKSASTLTAGGGQAHENRPPYYALCYIMRVN